jgi:hypothetical protein
MAVYLWVRMVENLVKQWLPFSIEIFVMMTRREKSFGIRKLKIASSLIIGMSPPRIGTVKMQLGRS